MPRIRTVKPAYPKHRKVRSVSRDARLLNIHLWCLADDEGRLQELIQWIIGEVFPEDEDVTPVLLREWLGELQVAGLIVRYEVDGERYIECHDFNDHQVINKPTPSEIPAPQAGSTSSRTSTGALPEDSLPEVEVEREVEREVEKEQGKGIDGDTPPLNSPPTDLAGKVWGILAGGIEALEGDWKKPDLEGIRSLVASVEPEVAESAAREAREIVQDAGRAPNITGLFKTRLDYRQEVRSEIREALA